MDNLKNWLLLPKQFNDNKSWMFNLGQDPKSPLHDVQFLAFKVEDIRGLEIFLRNQYRELAKKPQTKETEYSVKLTKWMSSFIGDRTYHRPVPHAMVDALNRAAHTHISSNDVIFLQNLPEMPSYLK